jgi:FlaA1/EpsC-like NDP-sugar epimerase
MRNRYVLLADLPIVVLAALGAFVLRFDWLFPNSRRDFLLYAAAAVLIKPVVLYGFGMYSRYWRYASVQDLLALALAGLTSSVVMGLLVTLALVTHVVEQFARSVVLIDGLLFLVGGAAIRVSVRLVGESRARSIAAATGGQARRILICGAGDAGAMVAREMLRNPQLGMTPIGFVDDDRAKVKKMIYGLPVFGPLASLAEVVRAHAIDEVTISMPSVPGKVVRTIAEQCHAMGIPSRTMPGMYELLDGNVSVNRLRRVDIVDLLRRSEVEWSVGAGDYVTGRSVLVTGAGGSIGLELCRQVAHRNPALLIMLGHGENSLFEAHSQMRSAFASVPVRIVIADVRDQVRIGHVFRKLRPDIVFHAAAHKHVPLMEDNPEEAISNNVLGTRTVVQAAVDAQTQRFVLISSDKAVTPSSMMGAAKRLAEEIVIDAARRFDRPFAVVRFGNVLGSRGSVVPIFKQQIENGGPITITHPDMRRFFMTIPEAVHLVLEAGGLGKGGELFVLRMGEAVRIVDLAQELVRLSGLSTDEIPIVFTGVRPGEKLEERLWEDGAEVTDTAHPDVLQVREGPHVADGTLSTVVDALEDAVHRADVQRIHDLLAKTIVTFAPRGRHGTVQTAT